VFVHIFNEQTDLKIPQRKIKPLVLSVLEHFNQQYDEVSLYFVSKEKIEQMHLIHFDDPGFTDCISFPMDVENDMASKLNYKILGEIFVCPLAAIEYANEHNTPPNQDPYHELSTLIVHGMLHLLGYQDTTPKLKEQMFKKQDVILNELKIKNLLLSK